MGATGVKRYYSGVLHAGTTTCCSAFALIVLASVAVAERPAGPEPFRLFPVRPAWELRLNNDLIAPPGLAGNRGYFPIEGDRIAAYDIHQGKLLWVAPVRSSLQPAVGSGLVFVVDDKTLIALRDDTGVAAWRTPLTETFVAAPIWISDWLVGTTGSGSVLAFRSTHGDLIWQRELGAPIRGSAAAASDRMYVSMEDGRVVALRIETGEPLWERRLGASPNDILALDDRLFVGSNDNYLYSMRARDGEVLWRWPTGADVVGRPVVDENRVYFVSLDNVLRALDRNSGNQRWKRVLGIRPTRGLVAADDLLIVSGVSRTAPAFLMQDGSPAGNISAEGQLASAPHIIEGDALPMLALVTLDIEHGAIVRAFRRSVEPRVNDMDPLPNPVSPVAPTRPSTP
jgi:outer membrane protein assembly factor BamB